VNIASRIESLSVSGGVFISEKVYDDIKNQGNISTREIGSFELKNVDTPMAIFAIKDDKLIVPKRETLTGKGEMLAKKRFFSKKLLISLTILLLLCVVSFFAFKKFDTATATAAAGPQFKSIAVLPFANLSGQKDDEYFADGICDEILTRLSKISALNVLSRTSTLQFRDTKKTMKEIGDAIGADVLLEGSVQKSNGKVRINVQLIVAATDKHIWAETYDRELQDVFSIQSDIAEQIAQALNTTLTPNEEELFSEKPTDNMEAFDLYLRGNKYADDFWLYTKMDKVPDAIRMYEEAIRLDSKFLNAYDGLVSLYTEISWRKPVVNYEQYRLKAKEWLDKMIALNIDNPIVHVSNYIYKYEGERDYEGALSELARLDKYFQNDKQTIESKAYVLRRMGRVDEALRLFLRQLTAYPKNVSLLGEVAGTYSLLRNGDSAIYYVDKALKLRPDDAGLYINKAAYYTDLKGDIRIAEEIIGAAVPFVDTTELTGFRIYLDMLKGNNDNAIRGLSLQVDSFYYLSQTDMKPNSLMLAILFNNQGNKEQAKIYFLRSIDILSGVLKSYPEDFRAHSALGIAYAGLGDKQHALAEGNKARDLIPISADAVVGIAPIENLALIYTFLGEQGQAIDILEQLLKLPFGWGCSNTIPLYKTYPYWKPLQSNPRFQKMIQ
jgi:serine/threonine-protein kinase